ncbi:MAG: hypothetical protein WBA61_11315 [Aequorivita sp.]
MKINCFLLLLFIGAVTYSQEIFFKSTCKCIGSITEDENQGIISEQIQNCFQQSFNTHHSEIGPILQQYVAANPETNLKAAEQNLSIILSEILSERCPRFKKLDQRLADAQKNSEEIIGTVAEEICFLLKDSSELTDSVVDSIIKEIVHKHQVSIYGQYNLDLKSEVDRFGGDLVQTLVRECERYRDFSIQRKFKKNK